MKPVHMFVLNAALVGAAILVYDAVRADSGPSAAPALTAQPDLAPLVARLDALERRLDGIDTTSERRVSTRLLQLEGRVSALAGARPAEAVSSGAATEQDVSAAGPDAAHDDPARSDGSEEAREVARVREALEQLEAERERERAARMVEGLIERLGLDLTDDQRQRLGEELGVFRQSMRAHFRSSLAAGLPRDEIRAGMEELRGALTETLGTFLSASDAEGVTAELGNRGPGGPGGGFGGRGN